MISEKLPFIFYGGEYAPEQWPETVWLEDVALMRNAGVNLVTVGVSGWGRWQPGPETYDFDWLDRVFDLLHQNGIAVNLCTGTATPPPWLVCAHPQVLPVNRQGARLGLGGRHYYCPTNPVYRELTAQLARQLAQRYGRHPALAMWRVHDDYGRTVPACYCENCGAQFRLWLQEKYGSLDALNEQWGTAFWSQIYRSWDEIEPPRLSPRFQNPGQQLDYARFVNQALLGCFLNEKREIKAETPDLPVTTTFTGNHGLLKSLDYFEWAQHVDFVSFGCCPDPRTVEPYELAFGLDLQRGLARGKPWALMAQPTSQVHWREHNALKRPGQMRLWTYQALARGADGIMFTQWRASRSGVRKFESAMLPHGGSRTRLHQSVVNLGQEVARLAEVCGGQIPGEIGLVLDWENYWATELEARPGKIDYAKVVLSYYRGLFEPDWAIDVVTPESDFARYKLLVVPMLYLVRDGVAERLKEYVDHGGTLVMGCFSGIVDANDRVLPGGFPGPFRELLGIHVEEMESLEPGDHPHLRSPEGGATCSQWVDVIELETAQALAYFADEAHASRPAVTYNAHGRGLAYYIGTLPDEAFLRKFFTRICDETGVKPAFRVPTGIEAVTRENSNGRFLFLLNHAAKTLAIELGPNDGTDMLSGEPVAGMIQLPAREVRVIRLSS